MTTCCLIVIPLPTTTPSFRPWTVPHPCFSPSLQPLFFSLHPLNFTSDPLHFLSLVPARPSADTPRDEQPWPSTKRCAPASELKRDPTTTPNSLKAHQLVRIFLFHPLPSCSFHLLISNRDLPPLARALIPQSTQILHTNHFQPPYFCFFLYRHSSSSAARSRVTLVCSEVRRRSFCRVCQPVFPILQLTHPFVLLSANA